MLLVSVSLEISLLLFVPIPFVDSKLWDSCQDRKLFNLLAVPVRVQIKLFEKCCNRIALLYLESAHVAFVSAVGVLDNR